MFFPWSLDEICIVSVINIEEISVFSATICWNVFFFMIIRWSFFSCDCLPKFMFFLQSCDEICVFFEIVQQNLSIFLRSFGRICVSLPPTIVQQNLCIFPVIVQRNLHFFCTCLKKFASFDKIHVFFWDPLPKNVFFLMESAIFLRSFVKIGVRRVHKKTTANFTNHFWNLFKKRFIY